METEKESLLRHQLDESGLKLAKLSNELNRITKSLEHTQSDLKAQAQRTKALWGVAIALVACILGIAWVGSPLLTEHGGLRNRLPLAQAAMDSMDGRLGQAEDKVSTLEKAQPVLADRIGKIEVSSASGLKRARSESIALAEGIKREMTQNRDSLSSRIGGLESTQIEAHEEVAALKGDLAGVRYELAEARNSDEQQGLRIGELAAAQLSTRGHVASMELQLSAGQDRMDTLSSEVGRQRVDFEVSKNKADQLVEGVYLTVRKTDVGKQQVDGWLHIVSDGRIVWLRDVGAQHPIAFASTRDSRPYQLVFTRIAGKGVVGYLLVPKIQASGEGAN